MQLGRGRAPACRCILLAHIRNTRVCDYIASEQRPISCRPVERASEISILKYESRQVCSSALPIIRGLKKTPENPAILNAGGPVWACQPISNMIQRSEPIS